MLSSLFVTTDGCSFHITAHDTQINMSVSCSILPTLMNSERLKLLYSGNPTLFWLRTDFVVLTLIQTASHSVADFSSASWRPCVTKTKTNKQRKTSSHIICKNMNREIEGGPFSVRSWWNEVKLLPGPTCALILSA